MARVKELKHDVARKTASAFRHRASARAEQTRSVAMAKVALHFEMGASENRVV
jgi:hypothetical protein